MKRTSPLLLGAGFTVWALAFVALYAMLSVGCRFGWDTVVLDMAGGMSLQRLQLIAIFLVHLAAGAAVIAALRRRRGSGFLYPIAYFAAIAALGASVFSFAGVFFLTACL